MAYEEKHAEMPL